LAVCRISVHESVSGKVGRGEDEGVDAHEGVTSEVVDPVMARRVSFSWIRDDQESESDDL
jgi:hypothetical protein